MRRLIGKMDENVRVDVKRHAAHAIASAAITAENPRFFVEVGAVQAMARALSYKDTLPQVSLQFFDNLLQRPDEALTDLVREALVEFNDSGKDSAGKNGFYNVFQPLVEEGSDLAAKVMSKIYR